MCPSGWTWGFLQEAYGRMGKNPESPRHIMGWKCPSDFLKWHTVAGFQMSKEGWKPC